MTSGELQIELLGGLRIWRGDLPIELRAPKQRTVLAALALQRGNVVSTDHLIDALWGESPPRSALTTLRSYVSNLRSALGGDEVTTQPPGYVLDVPIDAVDLHRLRRLLAEEDSVPARQRMATLVEIDDAGADLLPEMAYESFVLSERARLEEQVAAAREALAAARLDAGDATEVVVAMRAILDADPGRERARALHMRALFQSGRQVDALASYQEQRRYLADELGLEPSEELRELERRILAHDPELVPVGEPVHPLPMQPPPRTPIAGRLDERAVLDEASKRALAGDALVVAISGPAGIGKSRLLEYLVDLRGDEAAVAWGRCTAERGAPSLWPWTQVYRSLGDEPAALADASGALAEAARFELHDAVAGDLRSRAPLVLVFEDVHWADLWSLRMLQHVLDDLAAHRSTPIVVALSYRSDEVGVELAGALGAISRFPHLERMVLDGLSAHDAADLVADHGMDIDAETLGLLVERTGGNPLFLHEMIRAGAVRGADDVPQAVAQHMLDRVSRLGSGAADLLEWSALRSGALDPEVDRRLLAVDLAEVVERYEVASRGRVIRPDAANPTKYVFAHDLLRDAIRGSIAPRRASEMHAEIGRVLLDQHDDPDRRSPPTTEIAHHLVEGAAHAGADLARTWCLAAARSAVDERDLVAAIHWYRRVRRLDRDFLGRSAEQMIDFHLELAGAYRLLGGAEARVRTLCLEAAEAARTLDDPDRLARVALRLAPPIPDPSGMNHHDATSLDLIAEALGRAGVGSELLEALKMQQLNVASNTAEARAAIDAVLEQRDLGPAATARLIYVRLRLGLASDEAQDIVGRAEQALELAGRAGDEELEFFARRTLYLQLRANGENGEAERVATRTDDRALALGLDPVLAAFNGVQIPKETMAGDVAAAYRSTVAVTERFRNTDPGRGIGFELMPGYLLGVAADSIEQQRYTLSLSLHPLGRVVLEIGLVAAAVASDQADRIGDLVDDPVASLVDAPDSEPTMTGDPVWIDVLTEAGLGLDALETIYDRATGQRGRLVFSCGSRFGCPADYFLARGAIALGRHADADAHLDAGRELVDRAAMGSAWTTAFDSVRIELDAATGARVGPAAVRIADELRGLGLGLLERRVRRLVD